jgi:hypothetical protein
VGLWGDVHVSSKIIMSVYECQFQTCVTHKVVICCSHNNEWDNNAGVRTLIASLYRESMVIADLAYPAWETVDNN